MNEPAAPRTVDRLCPICGKPTRPETRPFCSRRCADIDLARWFGGVYSIPAEEPEGPPGPDEDDGS